MGNPLGVYETMYKLKNEEKVFLREIWLASQNVTTRVSLLYIVSYTPPGFPICEKKFHRFSFKNL